LQQAHNYDPSDVNQVKMYQPTDNNDSFISKDIATLKQFQQGISGSYTP
jgi:hypothetical protein